MADKPKRPVSAFMIWLNSAREQIKKENPGIKVTEVSKKGIEIWREMNDKSEWIAKAAKAKADYDEIVKKFEENGGGMVKGGVKRRIKAVEKPAKKMKKTASEAENDI